MTLPSSLNSGCVNAPASFTASLIAEMPVFICECLLPMDRIILFCVQEIFKRRGEFQLALPAANRFFPNRPRLAPNLHDDPKRKAPRHRAPRTHFVHHQTAHCAPLLGRKSQRRFVLKNDLRLERLELCRKKSSARQKSKSRLLISPRARDEFVLSRAKETSARMQSPRKPSIH